MATPLTACKVCGTPRPRGRGIHCKPCTNVRLRAYYKTETGKAVRRRAGLLARRGMTQDEYLALLESQGGGCAICGSTESGVKGAEHLDVDHDPACCPGKTSCGRCTRGLLCRSCNVSIGRMGHDTDRLIAAAMYLIRHKEEVVA